MSVFFLLLAKAVNTYIPDEFCVAPLSTAPPVNNGKLLQVQVLIRHGSRSPGTAFGDKSKTGEWYCDEPNCHSPRFYPAPNYHPRNYRQHFDTEMMPYKPSCREKDLLTIGMQQHIDLGKMYRKYVIEDNKLVGEKFSPDEVLFRGTEADRTLRSGVSFMQGMFPPSSPNEVISYLTGNDAGCFLHPSSDWCSELIGADEFFFNSEYFKNYWTQFGTEYKAILQEHGINWNPKTVKKFAAYVTMVDCTNHTVEEWITPELAKKCYEYVTFYNYGPNVVEGKYFGVGASAFLRELFRMSDEFISMENRYKFILLSSHDTMLVALYPVLGITEVYGPSVRAHLAFELWEVNNQIMARFVYNGKPVPIKFLDNKELFIYSNFKLAVVQKGFLDHCFIPEWPKI